MKTADILSTHTESFCLVKPNSPRGEDWLAAHCDYNETSVVFGAIPVEHRYIADLILGALADGLLCQDTASGRFAVSP